MLYYTISYHSPHQQFIDIRLTIDHIQSSEVYLQLPAWRPGRYEIANFAKNIQQFHITDSSGHPVTFQKVTKDRWKVFTEDVQTIEVSYNYYAATMDGGNTWLDTDQLYINFINCMIYVEGRTEEEHQVQLQAPENYEVACGLSKIAPHTLTAPSFYHLVDSPMIASANLHHWTYQVEQHTFHIWIQGEVSLNTEKMIEQFKAFTEIQIATMGDFPCQDYHFLFQFLPYRAYHGVEHFNSTIITLGPAEQITSTYNLYDEFLGVSSHELFHTWNIIRIRPKEMMPYDYSRENYFPTGFVAEGVTTYYGDLFLARSGVFSKEEYFAELNKLFKRHFDNFGRHNHSIAESSQDLWLDGYTLGIPNRKVSIYVKGALVSLILDLSLRNVTQHKQSLDTVMRYLWEHFGKIGRGYTIDDLKEIIDELSGGQLPQYFEEFIYGTLPLEAPLNELLNTIGCRLQASQAVLESERNFGFKTATNGANTMISAIAPDSIANSSLRINDEIIAVNNRKVNGNLDELLRNKKEAVLTIFRQNQLQSLSLKADHRIYYTHYTIEQKENASTSEKESFEKWLHCPW